MQRLILLGAGAFAKACLDVIEAQGRYEVAGFLDRPERVGELFCGYPILGDDEEIGHFVEEHHFLVATNQHLMPEPRTFLFRAVIEAGGVLASPISPRGYVSPRAELGAGSLVMHGAIVEAGAKIGRNCILNTGALIGPEVTIGDHCHIGPGAVLCAGAQVGDLTLVGPRSVYDQRITSPARSAVPLGSVVYRTQRGQVKVHPEGLKHEDA